MFAQIKLKARTILLKNFDLKLSAFGVMLLAAAVTAWNAFDVKGYWAPLILFVYVFVQPVSSMVLRIKQLRGAKGDSYKIRLSVPYALRICLLNLYVSFLKLRDFVALELLPITMIAVLYLLLLNYSLSFKAVMIILAGIAVLFVTGLGFYAVTVQKYARSEFYLAAYENLTVREAVELSAHRSKGERLRLLLFKAGFIPWFVSCITLLPVFFVFPYYKQSLTCYFADETSVNKFDFNP